MTGKLETRTFLWSLLAISLIFIWLLKPFFGSIFWACALAIIFFPLQTRILKRWPGKKNIAALATLLLCITVLITPIIFVFSTVAEQGMNFYQKLQTGEINIAFYIDTVQTRFPELMANLKKLGVDVEQLKADTINAALAAGKFAAQHALSYGQNAFGILVSIVLMLYITFFMLRDGETLIELLVRALPLGDARERMLFALFAEVTRATIKGNILIAVIQGTIGGITLGLLGIQGTILWTVMMCFASLIPAIGSALIWIPMSLYLFTIGQTTSAFILIGVGAGIIGTIDSVLRPLLVGRDTKLPDYLVLLSTLGGIGLFGMNGFVIGPLVAALFLAFWGIFMREVHVLAIEESEPIASPVIAENISEENTVEAKAINVKTIKPKTPRKKTVKNKIE